MHLADGHHRHEDHWSERLLWIKAYVIDGTREDAVEYAAMANQETLLPRTDADITKQLDMLFAIPKWWERSNRLIADHVGVSPTTVARRRAAYAVRMDVTLPEAFRDASGRTARRPAPASDILSGAARPRIRTDAKGRMRTAFLGKRIDLGKDPAAAAARLDEALASARAAAAGRRRCLDPSAITEFLRRRGFACQSFVLGDSTFGIAGYSRPGLTFVTAILSRKDTSARNAIGSILPLRQYADPTGRAVVVCYPEDGPEVVLDQGRALGVEFLTPDELMASLEAGKKGETDGQR